MAPHDDSVKVLLWLAVAVLGAAALSGLLGGWIWGGGWMGGMMGFGPVWMLGAVAIMVLMATHMFSHGAHSGRDHASHGCIDHAGSHESRTTPSEDAHAIIERCYASGEVSRAEYLQMKNDLLGGRPR